MEEQKLEITTRVDKNGKEHKNIDPKRGLENGNFVVVEKIFAEGKGFPNQFGGTSYIVGVKYLDEEVSFFLDEKPHEIYKECGGIGDSVKITSTLTENPVTKGTFYKKLSFDLL